MRILIDGGSLQEDRLNAEKTEIIFRCLHILMKKETGADWFLLTEDPKRLDLFSALPAEKVVVGKPLGGIFGKKFGQPRRILSAIRQSEANRLLTFGGADIPGLPIPQSNLVFAFSEQEKKQWIETHNRSAGKIPVTGNSAAPSKPIVLYGGPDERVAPIPWVEREKAKISFAAGREYFLLFFTGLSTPDLVSILKAFSLFKKRQQCNMQMVLAGSDETDDDFREKLRSYKYREDVHIRENLPNPPESSLIAAAYALLSPFAKEATGLTIFNAFQSGVPVIVSGAPSAGSDPGQAQAAGPQAEIAGEAALYAEPGDTTGLADRMMSLYKDENLRNGLIDKGKSRLSLFGWDASAQKVWNEIIP